MMMLSFGWPGVTGSSLVPPLRKFSYVVISNLPFFFLASWHAKQFSLRIGATSLMKLTGPFASSAEADGTGPANISHAKASASSEHNMQ